MAITRSTNKRITSGSLIPFLCFGDAEINIANLKNEYSKILYSVKGSKLR